MENPFFIHSKARTLLLIQGPKNPIVAVDTSTIKIGETDRRHYYRSRAPTVWKRTAVYRYTRMAIHISHN